MAPAAHAGHGGSRLLSEAPCPLFLQAASSSATTLWTLTWLVLSISSALVQTPNSSVPHHAGPLGHLHIGHLWPVRSHRLDWNRPPCVLPHLEMEKRERRKLESTERQELRPRTGAGRPDRGDASEGKRGELGNGPWSGA